MKRFNKSVFVLFIAVAIVSLSSPALAGPVFTDGFESGTYSNWTAEAGAYTRNVTSATAAVGTYSYTQTGGFTSHQDGISAAFDSINPTYISFYARTDTVTGAGQANTYFVIDGPTLGAGIIYFYFEGGEIQVYDGSNLYSAGAYTANTWYHVEFRNIDWTNRTFDFYVDNTLVSSGIPFKNPNAAAITQLHLYNYSSAQSWYDEIIISTDNAVAYIRGATDVWGTSGQDSQYLAMTTNFSSAWDEVWMSSARGAFEYSGYDFIYMDGSDYTANELNDFLTANRTAIESWVSNGGRLLLNSAPNEGGNIDFGFGGATLIYPGSASAVEAADPTHPVFQGPYGTVASNLTGGGFSHAYVSGGDLTPIIVDSNDTTRTTLGEKLHGSGIVLMGGMTTANFHDPDPDAENLRANIISYTESFIARKKGGGGGGGGGCFVATAALGNYPHQKAIMLILLMAAVTSLFVGIRRRTKK